MKTKLIVLALLTAAVTVQNGFAGTLEEERDAALKRMRGVPPLEMPARAVQVIAGLPPAQRSEVATAVLQALAQQSPSAAPAVQAALVKSGALPPVAAAGGNSGKGNGRVSEGNTGPGNGNGNGNSGQGSGITKPSQSNGRFPTAPPHGGNPPGHNGQPDRKGPPPFVDYTKPRSF